MSRTEPTERLREWFAAQLPGASDLTLEGFDHVTVGHSSETIAATLAWRADDGEHRRDVVLRAWPVPPGLLEPYDLHRQFTILRAIDPTPVPAPRRRLWYEPTGNVLGREFYVMERLDGTVYEGALPAELEGAGDRLGRCPAASWRRSWRSTRLISWELASAASGRDHLDRELADWTAELRRVQRDHLPALERLAAELTDRRPEPSPTITLVHGDPKPGNFAFLDDAVSVIFDWELATVGDPLADVGYLECMWSSPASFTSRDGVLTVDEFVAHYECLTGYAVRDREWYRAIQDERRTRPGRSVRCCSTRVPPTIPGWRTWVSACIRSQRRRSAISASSSRWTRGPSACRPSEFGPEAGEASDGTTPPGAVADPRGFAGALRPIPRQRRMDRRHARALVDRSLAAAPQATINVWSEARPWHGTYSDVRDEAMRLVDVLRAEGLEAGDVVAFQLPNWREAIVVFYACSRSAGHVLVPIVHIYGPKEVRFILAECGARGTSRRISTVTSTTSASSTAHHPKRCPRITLHVVTGAAPARGPCAAHRMGRSRRGHSLRREHRRRPG